MSSASKIKSWGIMSPVLYAITTEVNSNSFPGPTSCNNELIALNSSSSEYVVSTLNVASTPSTVAKKLYDFVL